MVKKISFIAFMVLFFSSCSFFGASVFNSTMSEDLSEIIGNSEVRNFYIIENDLGDEYLILVLGNYDFNAIIRVLIFDLSLNLRGYLEDGKDGASTDGVAFIEHDGNFVIGQSRIQMDGTTDTLDFVPVPGLKNNTLIYRWTQEGINYYVKVDYMGTVSYYDEDWNYLGGVQMPDGVNGDPLNYCFMTPSPEDQSIYLGESPGNLYRITKEELFGHVTGVAPLSPRVPLLLLTDSNLDFQRLTIYSNGLFVSTYSGEYNLLSFNGTLQKTIDGNFEFRNICTIDYGGEYFYYYKESLGKLIKERVPD
ncbi:MAG: hypothetical protein JEY91_07815 [Spirochaetaceae bacterium]|nr:hypothetical protein [Spirochaetaceae bacterium]